MNKNLRDRILIAAFQVNLLLFIVSACCLDSESNKPLLIVIITGTWMALFLFANSRCFIRSRIRDKVRKMLEKLYRRTLAWK